MNLNKLYEKQAKLDKYILEKHNTKMSKEELLDNTILALLVEVGELANTTRCFKHWSTKGMMDKEVVLDELADVYHFYLSIGNQLECSFNINNIENRWIKDETNYTIQSIFRGIYEKANEIGVVFRQRQIYNYTTLGIRLYALGIKLNFTDEEIEQAYLKKHEENYKRQREGY